MSQIDDEVEALRTAYVALSAVDHRARDRALVWLKSRFLSEDRQHLEAVRAAVGASRLIGKLMRQRRRARDRDATLAESPKVAPAEGSQPGPEQSEGIARIQSA